MKLNLKDVLFLEARGCYFGAYENSGSDVGNYRVGIYNHSIRGKNGINYILEFTRYDKRKMRYTNKRTGEPLKHPVYEIVVKDALHLDTEYEKTEPGFCYPCSFRDCKLEKHIHEKNYTYTKENILNVVNEISQKQYTQLVIVCDFKILDRLKSIYNNSGYREKIIIDNLQEVKHIRCDKDYYIMRFIACNGDWFEYDYFSNRITN